ncbi:MAG: hypothetical protein GXO49_04345 [Chlorobi bacterium]|nr:hypothetical protein [Chlorobiota bacterium]
MFSFVLFLIIYPYTKEINIFRAKDITWDILNQTKKYKKIDIKDFKLFQSYDFSKEVLEMDGKKIAIKGFIKKENHGKHTDIILTETVTDVCFMCNHDEHYNMILLKPASKQSELFNIKDDAYIKVEGVFSINKEKNNNSVYQLNNAKLKELINGN